MIAQLTRQIDTTWQTTPPQRPPFNPRAGLMPFVRRWKLIALSGFVPALLVFVWLDSKPSEYTASAQILLNKTKLDLGNIASLTDDGQTMREQIFTEAEVILSQPVLHKAAQELNRSQDNATNPPASEAKLLSRVKVALFGLFGFKQDAPTEEHEVTEDLGNDILHLRQAIQVSLRPDTYIADIKVGSTDRGWAMTVANLVANAYLDQQREKKLTLADSALEGINSEVEALEANLASVNARLVEIRRANAARTQYTSETAAAGERRLADELAQVRVEIARTEAESVHLQRTDQIPASQVVPGTDYEEVAVLRRRIIDLQNQIDARVSRLGINHAEMVTLRDQISGTQRELQDAIDRNIQQIQARVEILRDRETRIIALLAEAHEARLGAQVKEQEIDPLVQQADALKSVYAKVMERRSEIAAQRALAAPDSTLLAAASLPVRPSGPQVLPLSVAAFILGAVGASASIALGELFRGDYRDLVELENAHSLPAFCTAPRVPLRPENPGEAWTLTARYLNSILEYEKRGRRPEEDHVIAVTSLTPLASSAELARVIAGAGTGARLHTAVVISANQKDLLDGAGSPISPIRHADDVEMQSKSSPKPSLAHTPGTFNYVPIAPLSPGVVRAYWYQVADEILLVVDALKLDRGQIDDFMADLGSYRVKVRLLALREGVCD